MNVRPNSKIVELKLHAYIFARNVNIIEKLKFRKIQLLSNDKKPGKKVCKVTAVQCYQCFSLPQ